MHSPPVLLLPWQSLEQTNIFLDEMRKITRQAKDQESRLRADLREVQRKLDAEEKYAQKVKEEREDLRQVVKKQKVELGGMEEKVKTLEADAGRHAEELIKFKQHWTDTIQRAVEKCTRKYVDNLDSCFPGATYEFSCGEDDPPASAKQGEAASQASQNNAKHTVEPVDSVAADYDGVSISSRN